VTPAHGFPRMHGLLWGGSSAGRASRSQCEGREFDPPPLHQILAGLAVLLFATLCLAAQPARAQSIAGVLRIGTPGDYAPYSWYDTATGAYRGSDVALARALAARLGLRAQFVSTTWANLVPDAEAGRFDIAIGGISITAERRGRVDFSRPYTSDRKQPVVRCGEERSYDTTAEINRAQVRLVVNPGGTNERFAREHFPAATLTVHADNRSVFDEIRNGRADVMVTDAVEGKLQQRAGEGLCVAQVREIWAPADKAVLIRRGALDVHEVDAALRQLGKAYRRELSVWEGYGWSTTATPGVQLAALIDERLAVVTEVARSKWNTHAAIEDPVRERALLQSLRERARQLNIPAEQVDRFFRAQIEAAKQLQTELFAQWRKQKRGQFAGVADLATEMRPEIDWITSRMLDLLPEFYGISSRHISPASTLSLVDSRAVKTAQAPMTAAGT
jgi:chorismate mutase-like protein